MKVILLEEVKGKGGEGDVIEVTRGFANNYLLRNGMAILATKGNLKQLEQRKHNIAKREEVRIANAEELREKLEGQTVQVDARVGEEGQLFGSVTAAMIAEAIQKELDVEIDKRRIELGQPIKIAGQHAVAVSLYRTIKATINLWVGDEKPAEVEEAEEVQGNEEIEIPAEAVEAAADLIEVVGEVLKVAGGGEPSAPEAPEEA